VSYPRLAVHYYLEYLPKTFSFSFVCVCVCTEFFKESNWMCVRDRKRGGEKETHGRGPCVA